MSAPDDLLADTGRRYAKNADVADAILKKVDAYKADRDTDGKVAKDLRDEIQKSINAMGFYATSKFASDNVKASAAKMRLKLEGASGHMAPASRAELPGQKSTHRAGLEKDARQSGFTQDLSKMSDSELRRLLATKRVSPMKAFAKSESK